MIKVPYGQDAYSVIGKYIRDHITAIEDIIAVIKIDNITTNQLFMVDMNEENYFIWNNDWYEGEKDVALMDFFPVSEAINPSAQPDTEEFEWCHDCKEYDQEAHCCHRWTKVIRQTVEELREGQPEPHWISCSERLPEKSGLYIVTNVGRWVAPVETRYFNVREKSGFWSGHPGDKVLAWMPLPEPYKEEHDERD